MRILWAGLAMGLGAYAFPNPDGMCQIVTGAVLPEATQFQSRLYPIQTLTCDTSQRFLLVGGTLPPGMSLDPLTGTVFGQPTTVGIYAFSVRILDGIGKAPSKTFVLRVNSPLQIERRILASAGGSGSTYADQIAVTGGVAPYIFTLTGSLPPGLTLNAATGAISGVIGAGFASPANFSVQVNDSSQISASVISAFQITPNSSRNISTLTLPNGTKNVAYSSPVSLSPGSGGTYSIVSGALPSGLTVNGSGVVSGTPTVAGSFWFTLQSQLVSAGTVSAAWRTYNITIGDLTGLQFTTGATPPTAEMGAAYRAILSPVGGVAPFVYSVTAGTLPAGVVLDGATGVLHGDVTFSSNPSTTATIQVTDARGTTSSQAFTFPIDYQLLLGENSLPAGTVGTAYSGNPYNAFGGGIPRTFGLYPFGAQLPAGLTIDASTGILSGTPTESMDGSPRFMVTDDRGGFAVGSLGLRIAQPVVFTTSSALPDFATSGGLYAGGVTATGGTPPYTYTIDSNTFPIPPTMNGATGDLSFDSSPLGSFTLTARVVDSLGRFTTKLFSMNVVSTLAIANRALANGFIGVSYSQTINIQGASTPILFTLLAGSLPPGLTLSPAGALTGTPNTLGTFDFTIRAAQPAGGTRNDRAFRVVISQPHAFITTSPLPVGGQGSAYSTTLATSGGIRPPRFRVESGSLPSGLLLNSDTGVISGIPTATGTFTINVLALDQDSALILQSFQIVVGPAITFNTPLLPPGTLSASYSASAAAFGGTGARTYSVFSGSLPTGLSLVPGTGLIEGTPTAAGTFVFAVRATDAIGVTATQSYTVVVSAPFSISTTSPIAAGALNQLYGLVFGTAGGSGGARFTILNNAPVSILNMVPATGRYEGLPVLSGTYSFTVSAIDTDGRTAQGAFSHTIGGPPVLSPTLPGGTISQAYSSALLVAGGTGPYSFQLASGSLPPGLILAPSTGVISGTPTTLGTFNFGATVTDSGGLSNTQFYAMPILDAFTNSTVTLPLGTVGVSYSATIVTAGGVAPVTFALGPQPLPPGLTLNTSTGAITGVPTTTGTFTFTIIPTDGALRTAARTYSITVSNALSITTLTLPNGTVGTAYASTVASQNGVPPVTFAVTTGTLPAGLTLVPSTGAISGTPTTAGASTFTITANDSTSQTAQRSFTITITAPFSISTLSLPSGTVGLGYSATLATQNAAGVFSFAITAGSLPAGVTLSATIGTLSGTPTAAGTSTFTVTATDAQSQTAQRSLSITIDPALTISSTTLPNGTVGVAYSTTVATQNANGAVSFSLPNSFLPAGLSLAANTGVISGTPTTVGSTTFSLRAVDSLGNSALRTLTIVVDSGLTITTTQLRDGTVSSSYADTVATANGVAPITFAVTSGTLPAGLALATTTGTISGTPTASGLVNFTVTATDARGQSAVKPLNITVLPRFVITTTSLPNGIVGSVYNATVQTQGLVGSAVFSLLNSSLPNGLTLNATTGALTGTPLDVGTSTFTVYASDSADAATRNAQVVLSITVGSSLSITTSSLPLATAGVPYSQTFAATGGIAPYTWSVIGGTLPPNLTLAAATGNLSGNILQHGANTFTVRVTDSRGSQAERVFTLQTQFTLSVTAHVFPLEQGQFFSSPVTVAGGSPPYRLSLVSGAPPAGIAFNASQGTFSGTTNSSAGQFSAVVQAVDSLGQTASSTILFNVTERGPVPLSLAPPTLPNGTLGVAYSAGVGASGGTLPYAFRISQGSLPPGVVLNNDGSLLGTPSLAGTFSFGIGVTDGAGRSAGLLYSVTIAVPSIPLSITTESVPSGGIGQPYSASFGATGGRAPYTFSLAGDLPPGVVLTSNGSLTGAPTAAGTFRFTVSVTDALSARASRTFAVTIVGPVEITTSSQLPDTTAGLPFSQTFSAAGGTPPYTFAFSGLPPGLTGSSSGVVNGTSTAAGPFSFSVDVTDARGLKGSKGFTLLIFAKLEISSSPGTAPVPLNQPVSGGFAAVGGKPPYRWAVTSGALPAGLAFDSATGGLSGSPTAAGAFSFGVTVTDTLQNTATGSATIRVLAPVTITTTSLPGAVVGTAYTASVGATGGQAPFAFSLAQGSLPAGVSLAADGSIAGNPTASGTFNVTVQVTDAARNTSTRAFSITVGLPPLPPLSFVGTSPTIQTGQQGVITVRLDSPYPVAITGTLTLSFTPNSANPVDDPAVQLTSGGRIVTFTIPAGQTEAQFSINPLRFQVGTVAGQVQLNTVFTPAGGQATTGPIVNVTLARSVPVINAVSLTVAPGGFTLNVEGFSNTREVSQMTIQFNPTPGSTLLETTTLTVPVNAAYNTWYASTASLPFGGGFRLALPLTVTGDPNVIDSVIVKISNSVGESQPVTGRKN